MGVGDLGVELVAIKCKELRSLDVSVNLIYRYAGFLVMCSMCLSFPKIFELLDSVIINWSY